METDTPDESDDDTEMIALGEGSGAWDVIGDRVSLRLLFTGLDTNNQRREARDTTMRSCAGAACVHYHVQFVPWHMRLHP